MFVILLQVQAYFLHFGQGNPKQNRNLKFWVLFWFSIFCESFNLLQVLISYFLNVRKMVSPFHLLNIFQVFKKVLVQHLPNTKKATVLNPQSQDVDRLIGIHHFTISAQIVYLSCLTLYSVLQCGGQTRVWIHHSSSSFPTGPWYIY